MNALLSIPRSAEPHSDVWDPYLLLGLTNKATEKQIRAAYRRLAKSTHADVSGDNAAFLAIKDAHDFLLDPAARMLWDKRQARISDEQRRAANAVLTQLCNEIIGAIVSGKIPVPAEHADIPQLMRKEILARIDSLSNMKANASRELSRNRLLLGKVSRKSAGDNLIERVIAKRVDEIEANITKMDDDLVVGEIMLSEIGNYRSSVGQEKTGGAGPSLRANDLAEMVMNSSNRFDQVRRSQWFFP